MKSDIFVMTIWKSIWSFSELFGSGVRTFTAYNQNFCLPNYFPILKDDGIPRAWLRLFEALDQIFWKPNWWK